METPVAGGSDSSLTVGDMAWEIVLRLDENEDDMRCSIRLVRLAFFSLLSSLVEGDSILEVGDITLPNSRLDRRLLIESGRPDEPWWIEDGLDGERIDIALEIIPGSIVIDLRRSANEFRVSLISSLTTVMEDLRSFLAGAKGSSLFSIDSFIGSWTGAGLNFW
jgi:hypothetical protein